MKDLAFESGVNSLDQYKQLAENYFSLLQSFPHPMAVLRKSDGCIMAINHHFCIEFNLPTEKVEQVGAIGFCDLSTGRSENAEASELPHIRVVDDGVIEFKTSNGIISRLKAEVYPVYYGRQDCWLVMSSTATGQKLTEKNAFKTENTYRSLVENLNDIVYTTDENAVVTYVSPNITQLSGYEPCEVIGKSFTEFVHPDDLPLRMEQFLKILGGENQATEYRLFTKTGTIRWVRTSARPIRHSEKVVGVQGILVDITDLKEIEEALRRSEEKYRIVIQHAKDAIFVIQGDHILFMNPSASEILGCNCDCIASRPFWEFVHPDDRAAIMDRYELRLGGASLSDRTCFRILKMNGDVRDVDLNAVLITWEEKPAVLNFLRDITVQKMMAAQLQDSQKMEALGTLAGGLAHNFNNLLMGINGNASLSMMGLDPSTHTCKHLEKIVKLVDSGSKLTHQLLDYARGGRCEMGTVDLNQLVRDVSETLTATKKQIRIHHKLSEATPCIKADRGQIEQVVLNLFLNAADAMPDGGDVSIETSCLIGCDGKKKAALSKKKDYVLLKVSDHGTGIPKSILDRIFEPFFSTKGSGRGTGLGLSTAYGIVKNHDGEIYVESKVKQGSSFFIYLPASGADSRGFAANTKAETVAGQGTILLVDDEPEVIEPSAKLLEHLGFAVFKASCGTTALELFQKNWKVIDLVILDLILPGISGKDLYYKFKKINPQIKVLLSSGFSLSGIAEELINNGCRGFIQKPYDIYQLSAKMMQILSAK